MKKMDFSKKTFRNPQEILEKYDPWYRVRQCVIKMNENHTIDQTVKRDTQFYDANLLISRDKAMTYARKAFKTKEVFGKFPGVENLDGPSLTLEVHLMLDVNEFFDLVGFDEETTKEGREIERLLLDYLVPGKYFLGW